MNLKKIVLYFSCVFLFVGCKQHDTGTWTNFEPLNSIDQYIPGYYQASLGKRIEPATADPSVYVDFSDGMSYAYSPQENYTVLDAIANRFGNNQTKWYGLGTAYGNDRIGPIENAKNANLIIGKVLDRTNYTDTYAPIGEAVKRITEGRNDALLITDFEEYRTDRTEETANFASQYFSAWLSRGNSITFFYSPYMETNGKLNGKKNLYFIFFTCGRVTDESMISKFRDALKNRPVPQLKTFELNSYPFRISNNYGGNDKTGISNQAFSKWVNYRFNGLNEKNEPYEVIGINKPWNESTEKYFQNIIQKEQGIFMNNLLLDASDTSSYRLQGITVNVYDVSEDYEKYARCTEAKKHIPEIVPDKKTKDPVWSENSAKDPIVKECYQSNSAMLKPEWIYTPADLHNNVWQEVFDIDQNVFERQLKNDPSNIDLLTTLNKNYKLKNIGKSDALIRIDYVIVNAEPNIDNNTLEDFKRNSIIKKENGQNKSLYESIRNALQEVKIKNRIIYSCYIRFANTSKK